MYYSLRILIRLTYSDSSYKTASYVFDGITDLSLLRLDISFLFSSTSFYCRKESKSDSRETTPRAFFNAFLGVFWEVRILILHASTGKTAFFCVFFKKSLYHLGVGYSRESYSQESNNNVILEACIAQSFC